MIFDLIFLHLDIEISDKKFIIPPNLYVKILCYLTFNVCAMLGSLTTSLIQWVSRLLKM